MKKTLVVVFACAACGTNPSQNSNAAGNAPLSFHGQALAQADNSMPIVDALAYDVSLVLNTTAGQESYQADVTGFFQVTQAEALQQLPLDFLTATDPSKGNVIDSVDCGAAGGEAVKSTVSADPNNPQGILVALPEAASHGKKIQVHMTYHANIPAAGSGGFGSGGLLVATNTDQKRIIYSMNWPSFGRQWLPLRDHPRDGAALAMKVTADSTFTIVSNGNLQSNTDNGDGTTTWQYFLGEPVPTYTFDLVAYNDYVSAPIANAVPMQDYLYSGDSTDASTVFGNVGGAMDFYQQHLGKFRWPRVSFLETPSGSMENTTAVELLDSSLHGDPADEGEVAYHELAHHWSGDLVRLGEWNDFWLNEGFAVYLDGRYIAAELTAAEYTNYRRVEELAYGMYADSNTREAGALHALRPADPEIDVNTIFDNISYMKGATVLMMLEHIVGTDAFDGALADWYDAHAFGAVETADWQAHLDGEFPEDKDAIDAVFTTFVYAVYHPEVLVDWSANGAEVSVTATQKQTLGPQSGFVFPLELQFVDATGTQTSTQTLNIGGMTTSAEFPLPFTPASVVSDPNEFLWAMFVCDTGHPCRDGYYCSTSAYFSADQQNVCVATHAGPQ